MTEPGRGCHGFMCPTGWRGAQTEAPGLKSQLLLASCSSSLVGTLYTPCGTSTCLWVSPTRKTNRVPY